MERSLGQEGGQGAGDAVLSTAEVEVRPATDADIDALLVLGECCFPEEEWTADGVAEALGRAGCLFQVAAPRGLSPVGFFSGWVVVDELEIAQVGVHPEWRGKGIGALLLQDGLLHAAERGVVAAFLEVRASNLAARALYAAHGFEHLGVRRGYYHHPREDALLLRARVDLREVEAKRRIFSCRSKHRVA